MMPEEGIGIKWIGPRKRPFIEPETFIGKAKEGNFDIYIPNYVVIQAIKKEEKWKVYYKHRLVIKNEEILKSAVFYAKGNRETTILKERDGFIVYNVYDCVELDELIPEEVTAYMEERMWQLFEDIKNYAYLFTTIFNITQV